MKQSELEGKIQTVLGLIDPGSLGTTLMHEHLICNQASVYFEEPDNPIDKKRAYEPIRLENLSWMYANCFNHYDNLKLDNEDLIVNEIGHFKEEGGNSIVELTVIGFNRDPEGLARIAKRSGLNIIMGAGFYNVKITNCKQKNELEDYKIESKKEEDLARIIINDILIGADGSGVRAGIIGEIGCSEPLQDVERKILRAAVIAQKHTGALINIHPSRSDKSLLEIVKILEEAGADLNNVVISHIGLMGFKKNTIHKILDMGCYVEYDSFGLKGTFYSILPDKHSDSDLVNDVIGLINEGYLNKILISAEHCFKHDLVKFGGYGYAHILKNIVPLMKIKGTTTDQIQKLLVDNPRSVLQFKPLKK